MPRKRGKKEPGKDRQKSQKSSVISVEASGSAAGCIDRIRTILASARARVLAGEDPKFGTHRVPNPNKGQNPCPRPSAGAGWTRTPPRTAIWMSEPS